MRSNGQNTEIKNPAALQQNSTPALELGDRGRGGGGCGYSGKIKGFAMLAVIRAGYL